ncbi:MAG: hypothetical protein QHJ73_14235, partial [Armatimonadota bacterium]|nr:hypothetical protein [Armatimonadota bacterium]
MNRITSRLIGGPVLLLLLAASAALAQGTATLTGGVAPGVGTPYTKFTFACQLVLPANPLFCPPPWVRAVRSSGETYSNPLPPAAGNDSNFANGEGFENRFIHLPDGVYQHQFVAVVNVKEERVPFAAPELGRGERSVCWSPDGQRIAFESTQGGNDEIFSAARDGSGVVRLTNSTSMDRHPAWSPDGTRIAFSSDRVSLCGRPSANLDMEACLSQPHEL